MFIRLIMPLLTRYANRLQNACCGFAQSIPCMPAVFLNTVWHAGSRLPCASLALFATYLRSGLVLSAVLMIMPIQAADQTALFVSLGSTCVPANFTRFCEVRTASFPFDWILSLDEEKFIEILEDDFSHFFNSEDLTATAGNVLLNTYYHLEFLHEEGHWNSQFLSTMETFKNRYERRITRFKNLKDFPGKVIFIRATDHDPAANRFFKGKETISEEQSLRLYNTLKRYFPNLDFTLMVLNFKEDETRYVIQKQPVDNLLMLTGPNVRLPDDSSLCDIFHGLMRERALLHPRYFLPAE